MTRVLQLIQSPRNLGKHCVTRNFRIALRGVKNDQHQTCHPVIDIFMRDRS